MNTAPGRSAGANWQATTDPAEEIEIVGASHALQTHGLSFLEGHLTNRFCYFRSRNFLEQRRDYLADYLERSRKTGYRTVVYFNVHAIKPAFGSDRPEWRQVRSDGTPIDGLYGVETSMCVNTGFRDWVRDVCLELCKYPIDGIFFDGPCVFRDCCYCDTCRDLYREEYGTEMPPKEPGHPALRRLAGFQSEGLRRFLAHARDAVKKVRPDVALYSNAGSREEAYYAVGRNNRVTIQSQDMLI